MSGFQDFLASGLDQAREAGLLRTLREIGPAQAPVVHSEGREFRNFSSNDYLGLAGHPTVIDAAKTALAMSGSGSGASRLVCGTLPWHQRLEEALARFKETEAAISFTSGYAAALGTIPALAGPGDVIILDKLCHACLVDAAKLSGAVLRVFPHNDTTALQSRLEWAAREHAGRRILVLAESVYSMDGDLAPLERIVELKDQFGAWLFLDEAHGVGVLGRGGRGLAEMTGVAHRIEVQMGTLGKALGSSGAYIAGSRLLREFLINRARSFIFSTAPTPASAAAAIAAIGLLEDPQTGGNLLGRLHSNIRLFCEGVGIPTAPSAIIPVVVGSEQAAMDAAAALLEKGFLVPAIRYPTVARGAARLRITLSAAHAPRDIEHFALALGEKSIPGPL